MAALLVDGETVAFSPGDSVAACFLRSGRLTLRRSRTGMARGLYCGIGICNECVVTVDDRRNVRSCVADAADGMRIVTGQGAS